MKKFIWIASLFTSLMLFGCSADELIRVGTPVEGGIEFDFEITDSEIISQVRTLIKEEWREIEKPEGLSDIAEAFFSLDRPKEGVAEIWRYVWYEEDGTSVLFDEFQYYSLTKSQTEELKQLLESK